MDSKKFYGLVRQADKDFYDSRLPKFYAISRCGQCGMTERQIKEEGCQGIGDGFCGRKFYGAQIDQLSGDVSHE